MHTSTMSLLHAPFKLQTQEVKEFASIHCSDEVRLV
jgi:hypothetical protein